jgi:hypothetical protein
MNIGIAFGDTFAKYCLQPCQLILSQFYCRFLCYAYSMLKLIVTIIKASDTRTELGAIRLKKGHSSLVTQQCLVIPVLTL